MITIDKKISEVSISKNEPVATPTEQVESERMNEKLKRPQVLSGATYKLKTPDHVSNHALYITINNIVLNEGTEKEEIRPFEIFINSKSMQNFESTLAMTRLMSAIFRKGGDVTFIVDELKAVFAPEGGYWNNGKYQKSLWSEIGDIIKQHYITFDVMQAEETESPESHVKTPTALPINPPCPECGEYALVISSGCESCSSCGFSKCG